MGMRSGEFDDQGNSEVVKLFLSNSLQHHVVLKEAAVIIKNCCHKVMHWLTVLVSKHFNSSIYSLLDRFFHTPLNLNTYYNLKFSQFNEKLLDFISI